MPKIDEIHIKKTKKFQKKEYRPWDVPVVEKETSELEDTNVPQDVSDKAIITDNKKNDDLVVVPGTQPINFDRIKRGLLSTQEQLLMHLIGNIESSDGSFHFIAPVYYSELADEFQTKIRSIKINLNKFKTLGLVELVEFKPGRGGYCFFRMPNEVFEYFSIT